MCTSNYQTSHLIEYLPKRYSANLEQEQNRVDVYSFKDGACPLKIKNKLCEQISRIAIGAKSDWIILFIPASTAYKTTARYASLDKTGIKSTCRAIYNKFDVDSKHISGVSNNPKEIFSFDASMFRNKKVILIDDVTTSGRSFKRCADELMSLGAFSVYGLFVAKTINPDWNSRKSSYGYSPEDYFEPDFDPEDYCEPDFSPEDYFEPDFCPEDCYEPDFCPEDYY